jgi:hypothetical protein
MVAGVSMRSGPLGIPCRDSDVVIPGYRAARLPTCRAPFGYGGVTRSDNRRTGVPAADTRWSRIDAVDNLSAAHDIPLDFIITETGFMPTASCALGNRLARERFSFGDEPEALATD